MVRETGRLPARPRDRAGMKKAPQWLHPPGGLVRHPLWHVVTAILYVRQEGGESVPADDVRAALGPLAVPDGGHAVQVGRDLDTAPVVGTAAGLPPDRLRQVGHAYSIRLARRSR